jgi:uncharacterized protein YqfA (UPF0365 family)
MTPTQVVALLVAVTVLIPMLLTLFVFVRYFRLWIKALLSGAPISIFVLIGMCLRRSDASAIVDNVILARQSGIDVTAAEMESAYVQRVDIEKVTLAAIEAKRRQVDVGFQELVALELQGRLAEKLGLK